MLCCLAILKDEHQNLEAVFSFHFFWAWLQKYNYDKTQELQLEECIFQL
jgi:hypothetical protein